MSKIIQWPSHFYILTTVALLEKLRMTKLSLVVCKIIDHSSEDVFSRPFGQVSEIGGILPFPVDVNTRIKL